MTEKTLDIMSSEDFSDGIKVHGNPDRWVLVCKASNAQEGWMKSTKVMEIGFDGDSPGTLGCLVQVTTQQHDHVAEALAYVPGAKLGDFING